MRRSRPASGLLVVTGALVLAATSGCSADGHTDASRQGEAPAAQPPATTRPPAVTRPDQLRPPGSAAETAAVLTRVERALRTDGIEPASRRALGWEQQLAYGALSQHPDWYEAVLAAMPAELHAAVAANHDAAVELAAPDLGAPPAELPDWTIRTPPPAADLVGYYREAEAQSGIRWQYLAAIHFVETRMGRIHGNSTAGAQGPMQFLPSTWAAFGEGGDIDADRDSILAAGRFLAARGGPTDMARALYSYNPSDHYVAAISRYADVLFADPRAYDGYYAWQVYITTTSGTTWLPEGWHKG